MKPFLRKVLLLFLIVLLIFILYPRNKGGVESLYLITKEDPLFASGEIECDKLLEPISEIKRLNNEILSRTGLKEDIIPVDFLESVCLVDKAQREFLEKKDKGTAHKMLSAYEEAFELYQSGILELRTKLNDLLVDKDLFVTVTKFMTKEMIISDLELMAKNADEIKGEIQYRKDILKGKKSYQSSSPIVTASLKEDFDEPKLMESEDLFYPCGAKKLGQIYSAKTSCFQNPAAEDYFYAYKNLRNGKPVFNLKLATTNYYSKHGPDSEMALFFNIAPESGFVFIPSKETNIYNCRDIDYYLSIMSMDIFLDSFEPIFSGINIPIGSDLENSIISDGIKAEELFFSSKIPSEKNFNLLGDHYFNGYLVMKGTPEGEEMLRRHLMINNKMAGMDMMLNTTIFLDVIETNLNNGVFPDVVDLYVIRSNYPFSFLNFSPAIWRIDQKPEYGLPVNLFEGETLFFEYDDLIEEYGREKLRFWGEMTNMSDWHQVEIRELTN